MKKLLALLALTIIVSQGALAQAPPPSGSPPGSFVGAPIDDSAWILAILMFVYGVYTLLQKQLKPALKSI